MDHCVVFVVSRAGLLACWCANLAWDEAPLVEEHLRRAGAVWRAAVDYWRWNASLLLLLGVDHWRGVRHVSHRSLSCSFVSRDSSVTEFSFVSSLRNSDDACMLERCNFRISMRSTIARLVAFSMNHFSHDGSWSELIELWHLLWVRRAAAANARLLAEFFFE